ncbi:2OG-Fe(II) oxygenase [Pseudofulvimonas gallinarii]|uniref:2-oxoglutarate-Fe(II)-dependent oxygenase superfamily protein n=1 Tax=Pseudofulvimonas gallinarii TaxID=634155 RepID=A0A4R3LDA8_9GAMM|nr:2OG-Fe(II) oxygenase [Pseudofulvimonas gallinarii]TCS97340.1 2-oxoglutarate-Fe(II)-dependent oxygenase superfamily protein [Pseudofulvimonas gallinarii]THD13178.1 hypothetical protein B1808_09130 [Pseudofulvimonas gallinarii]
MSVLAASLSDRVDALAQHFASASPFPHVVIPDFLDEAFCQSLLADFPDFEKRHALNEMGEVGGKAVRMDVRDISDSYRQLDALIQREEFLSLVSRITGIPDLLYDPDYLGGGTHENVDGQGLDVHVDFNYHPRTRWHRRLNLIIYLNPDWQAEWGGQLELHADPWSDRAEGKVQVPPLFNQCVIFETSEHSWHGFPTIHLPENTPNLSRKSFAIYLYTRERPATQTAPPHATVYVPPLMPDGWQAGRTLDDADLRELRNRFARLRGQLRYLYDRELRFGAQLSELEAALDEARRGQRLDIQGFVSQPDGCTGLWPDGWAGAALATRLVPTRPARSLRLQLWAPPQLAGNQTLRFELDKQSHDYTLSPGDVTTINLPVDGRSGRDSDLRIHAERVWQPAAAGDSSDQRELAYRVVSVVIE